MTWYGHVHSYSRTCPVYQRNCMGFNSDGSAVAPVHVLIGQVQTHLICLFASHRHSTPFLRSRL